MDIWHLQKHPFRIQVISIVSFIWSHAHYWRVPLNTVYNMRTCLLLCPLFGATPTIGGSIVHYIQYENMSSIVSFIWSHAHLLEVPLYIIYNMRTCLLLCPLFGATPTIGGSIVHYIQYENMSSIVSFIWSHAHYWRFHCTLIYNMRTCLLLCPLFGATPTIGGSIIYNMRTCLLYYTQIHRYYRSSGGTLNKAIGEASKKAASNKYLKNAVKDSVKTGFKMQEHHDYCSGNTV